MGLCLLRGKFSFPQGRKPLPTTFPKPSTKILRLTPLITLGSKSKQHHLTTQAMRRAGALRIPQCYKTENYWTEGTCRAETDKDHTPQRTVAAGMYQVSLSWGSSFSLGLWLPKTAGFVFLFLQSIFQNRLCD